MELPQKDNEVSNIIPINPGHKEAKSPKMNMIQKIANMDDFLSRYESKGNRGIIATGDGLGRITIWNKKLMPIKHLNGHINKVRCMIYMRAFKTLATGSYDTHINIWDIQSYQQLRTLSEHRKPIICLCQVSKDILASGGEEGYINLWDLATLTHVITIYNTHPISALCCLPSQGLKVMNLLSVDNRYLLKVWDPISGGCLSQFGVGGDYVFDIMHIADSRVLLSSLDLRCTLQVYDLDIDKEKIHIGKRNKKVPKGKGKNLPQMGEEGFCVKKIQVPDKNLRITFVRKLKSARGDEDSIVSGTIAGSIEIRNIHSLKTKYVVKEGYDDMNFYFPVAVFPDLILDFSNTQIYKFDLINRKKIFVSKYRDFVYSLEVIT